MFKISRTLSSSMVFQAVVAGMAAIGMLAIGGCSGGDGDSVALSSAASRSQLYISGNSSDELLTFGNANAVSGSATPNRTVSGGNTALDEPRGIAVDMARSRIYVANFAGNSILVFNNARTVSGDVTPNRSISNTGNQISPTGLFLDPIGDRLYVTSDNSVLVYENASGLNGSAITPDRILTGASTTLSAPTGVFVDTTRNLLYVTNGNSRILVFNDTAIVNGNIAPDESIPVSSVPAGIFVDVMADRLYVASGNTVQIFDDAITANNASTPDRMISGGGSMLNQPRDIFVDTGTDRLYVANATDDTVLVFNNASTANGSPAPSRILNLPAFTDPWGIYVDVTPIVIGSTANLDGYARSDLTASASGSPATGDKEASDSFGVGWRQLYSFDIADIASSAMIDSATLRLYQCDVQGLPYTLLGDVNVDQMNYGGVFDPFGSAYDGSAVTLNIGILSATPDPGYKSLNVTTQLQNDLMALRVRSQYRLRFSVQDFSFDGNDDYVQFTDAEDSLCAGAAVNKPPQLAVTLRP
jgi:DNA-binding beta-propeller fold protein YncE